MRIVGGARVYIVRPRTGHGTASLPARTLPYRTPDRLPPPEIAHELPSPLIEERERAPIAIGSGLPASKHRALWTLGQLAAFQAKRIRLKWAGRLDDETAAVMTRQLFQRLGGMWVKVGQLMSLRSDLMSEAMCRELSALQHEQQGFPFSMARGVIEEDLGKPLAAVFADFDPVPFAAASIAQVHRATLLRNNRAVVVKVMRPDIKQGFQGDVRLLEGLVSVFQAFGMLRRFRMTEGVTALRGILDEETNYRYEALNLKRMRKTLADHGVYVPRAFPAFCSERVLVMEEIPGVLMSQYIRMRREDPDRVSRWAVSNGIEEREVARRLSVSVLRQILEDNLFHGDLHPGNVMLLADSRIALLDFGSVGRLEPHAWMLYRHSLAALAVGNHDRAADAMMMLSPPNPRASVRALRRDMSAALRRFELQSQLASTSYADRSISAMSDGVAKVMARHDLPLSWSLMRVGRTMSTLDASLQTLSPDANFLKLCRAYFKDRQRRVSTFEGRMRTVRATLAELGGIAGDLQVLMGPQLRQQALRLHGIVGQVTRVRLAVLSVMSKGVWTAIVVMAVAGFLDEEVRFDAGLRGELATVANGLLGDVDDLLLSAIPTLNPFHWILLILFALFLGHLVRSARRSLAEIE